MKNVLATLFCLGCLTGFADPVGPEWTGVASSGHDTKWVSQDSSGNVQSFLEIQSGLNRQLPDGTWVRSSDEIEIVEKGAVVRGAQFHATFAGSSDAANGVFEVRLPQVLGKLRGQCIGVAYTAPSGESVFLGEIRAVQGLLVGRNEIVYPDCFTGIKADLRYRVTVGSIVQDVILRSKLPPPEAFGMDEARLEVWTEIHESPAVRKTEFRARTRNGKNAPDCVLDFGTMQIGAGRAYRESRAGSFILGSDVRVYKELEAIEGMTFLIESVDVAEVADDIATLPVREYATIDKERIRGVREARSPDSKRFRPTSLVQRSSPVPSLEGMPIRQVAAYNQPSDGYVLDFDLASSYTNYTFRSDTTYYASGPVNLYGGTTFEGGTVIKYAPTNSAQLLINSGATVNFRTDSYRPVILCARDDNSAGVTLTTNAITGFYADTAISFFESGSIPAVTFRDLRISDAKRGLYLNGSSSNAQSVLKNAQFVRCNQGVTVDGAHLDISNALFDGSTSTSTNSAITNFFASNSELIGQHLTINGSTKVFHNYGRSTLAITNSLIIAATNLGNTFASESNYTNSSSFGLFEEVGAGKHYLAPVSAQRNRGVTNINSSLLIDLRNRTTHAPIVITGIMATNTTWSPRALLDIDTPDLGFHYPRIDFIADQVLLTNATLTLTNGVVVGTYFNFSLYALDGGRIYSEGTRHSLNRFVDYSRVQEQPTFLGWSSTAATLSPYKYADLLTTIVSLRFTEFLGWGRYHIQQQGDYFANTVILRDCVFDNGSVRMMQPRSGSAFAAFDNNLFDRTGFIVNATNSFTFFNNLHFQGSAAFNNLTANRLTVRDCAFDTVSFGTQFANLMNSHNAYINCSGRINPVTSGDITTSSFSYTNGPLGRFYHHSATLLNVGSRNATNARLFHHTVHSSLAKETNSVVDIGFHYVSSGTNGIPNDSDSDGMSDYREDSDGDGTVSSLESSWFLSDTDADGINDNDEWSLGLDPRANQLGAGALRRDYSYDLLNRVTAVSGNVNGTFTLDAEGNVK